MQKINQKIDAFQKRFFLDFDRFWEGKWSQVGSKIVSEIDVNFERPIFTKTNKKQLFFINFCEFWDPSWVPKCIKNQSKNLIEDKVRLSIDFSRFWSILGGKLGSKWLQKSMQKRIEKTMQIQMRFGCVLGGCSDGRAMASKPRPPPHTLLKKSTYKHKRT